MVFNYTQLDDGKIRKSVIKPKNYAQISLLCDEIINYIKCMSVGISPPWKDMKGEERIRVRDHFIRNIGKHHSGKKLHPNMPMAICFTRLQMQIKIIQKNAKLICKKKGDLTATILKLPDVKGNGEYVNANMAKFMGLANRSHGTEQELISFPADVYTTTMALSFMSIYFRLFKLKNNPMPDKYEDGENDSNTVQDKKAELRKAFKKADNVRLDDNLRELFRTISEYSIKFKDVDGSMTEVDMDNQTMLPRITITSKIFTFFKTRKLTAAKGVKLEKGQMDSSNSDYNGDYEKVEFNEDVKTALRKERYFLKSLKEHLDIYDIHEANGNTKKAQSVWNKIRNLCMQQNFPYPPSSEESDDGFEYRVAYQDHYDANKHTRRVQV